MKFKAIIDGILMSLMIIFSNHAQPDDYPLLKGPYLGQKPPGMIPEIFAPGIVSTGKEHSAAMFTADGKEVWFGRMFPEKIYYMKRTGDKWSKPQIAPFCDTYKYLYPVMIQDGQKIFFTSNRPIKPEGKPLSRGKGDIWMVKRKTEGWSEPKHFDETINLGRINSCGSMAANGNFYFTARKHDKSTDIYYSRLLNHTYSAAENLAEINSPTPDHCPFVAPDESYVIFSSFRGGFGRSDLFISFRNRIGNWAEPKNMGSKINSAYKDEYPFVTPDGKYFLFNSNRPSSLNRRAIQDGPGNIFWVDAKIIEELKPDELK